MEEGIIALFEFVEHERELRISEERHYRLVPPEDFSEEDLRALRNHGAA